MIPHTSYAPQEEHTRYTITHIKKLLTHSSVHVHTYSQVRISFLGSQQLCLHPEYVPLHIARTHTRTYITHTHTHTHSHTQAQHVCSCMYKHSLHACVPCPTYIQHTHAYTPQAKNLATCTNSGPSRPSTLSSETPNKARATHMNGLHGVGTHIQNRTSMNGLCFHTHV